jgi:hypothetical protein
MGVIFGEFSPLCEDDAMPGVVGNNNEVFGSMMLGDQRDTSIRANGCFMWYVDWPSLLM